MKILFVCKANIFRSQVAAAIFKKICDKHEVRSAGTAVREDREGQRLGERVDESTRSVIEAMMEGGMDLSDSKRHLMTKKDVEWADKVVCMAQKETIPEFLMESKKMEYWEVEDYSPGEDYDFFVESRDRIKKKVERLAKEIC